MPELRWYYELYRNHKTGCQLALKFLEEAYSSKESDQKTIDLLFDSYLDTLAWGAHHFPDGCIIEKEKIIFCMQKCEDILNEKSVREDLINRLQYYKKLYLCYSKYVEDGKKRNFGVYLKEANIDFYYSKAYYYER